MPIKVVCKCGAKIAARDQLAGKDVECAACGATIRVPIPSPQGSGGTGKGVLATLVVTVVAVVGCGVMLYLQRNRIEELQAGLDAAARTEQARFDEMRRDLQAAESKAADDLQQEKDRLAKVQAELQAETQRRQSLADALDKVDMDTVRIRGDLQRVEQERRQALAESATKRAELDRQLAALQSELATKAGAQDTARIQAEIARVEQAKDVLAAQAASQQTKIAGYDRQVADLQTQLQTKVKVQSDLQAQLADAQSKLSGLEADNLKLNAADLPKQIDDLKRRVAANRSERYRTVVAEDGSGTQMSLRVDTATGQTTMPYAAAGGVTAPWAIPIFESNAGPNVAAGARRPGRFDVQVTYHNGDVHGIYRLDTEEGRVWFCTGAGGGLRWDWMPVYAPRARAGATHKWSMSVSTPGSSGGVSTQPVIVLTRSDGAVLDNALLGSAFLPRLP